MEMHRDEGSLTSPKMSYGQDGNGHGREQPDTLKPTSYDVDDCRMPVRSDWFQRSIRMLRKTRRNAVASINVDGTVCHLLL